MRKHLQLAPSNGKARRDQTISGNDVTNPLASSKSTNADPVGTSPARHSRIDPTGSPFPPHITDDQPLTTHKKRRSTQRSAPVIHYGQAVWKGTTAFLPVEEGSMDDNGARRKMLRL